MGKQSDGKIRPINLTLTTYGKKIMILKNKKKLEQSKIYIKEDFSPKILAVRKSLHEQLQKERREGKMAYLRYDKIVIREPNQNQKNRKGTDYDSNSKKRELEITPPPQAGNLNGTNKYQTAKKNKISSKGSQSSMINFVQKRDEHQASQSSTGASNELVTIK